MRQFQVAVVTLLVMIMVGAFGSLAPDVLGPLQQARNRAWVEDIAYLTRELERRHPNLLLWADRELFEGRAARLVTSVPAMTDSQIEVELARLLATLQDGHTSLPLISQDSLGSGASFRSYPLTGYWFPEGLFVNGVSQGLEHAYGCRIVKIGDLHPEEALPLVQDVISHDNDYWVEAVSPSYLLTPEILGALGIVPNPEAAKFTFEDASGSRFTLVLAPVSRLDLVRRMADMGGRPPLYRSRRGARQRVTYLPDSRSFYMQLGAGVTAEDVSSAVDALCRILDTQPVERVIVDLRHCSGTGGTAWRPLLLEMKRRDALLGGRLACIIGRGTVSGGIITALLLKDRAGAVLVGEPTGGRPSPSGSAGFFRLPNSGLLVACSDELVSFTHLEGPFLAPDFPVETTAAQYFAGQDPVLEAALSCVGFSLVEATAP